MTSKSDLNNIKIKRYGKESTDPIGQEGVV